MNEGGDGGVSEGNQRLFEQYEELDKKITEASARELPRLNAQRADATTTPVISIERPSARRPVAGSVSWSAFITSGG